MTKEEMMKLYYSEDIESNYEKAQEMIQKAMKEGEKYVYLPGKNSRDGFGWCATPETIARLREDGFDIDVFWNPWDYWSVEWGYKHI